MRDYAASASSLLSRLLSNSRNTQTHTPSLTNCSGRRAGNSVQHVMDEEGPEEKEKEKEEEEGWNKGVVGVKA